MWTFKQFVAYFKRKNPPTLVERAKPPRIRVLDTEVNRSSEHWRPLIGQEGIFLGKVVDDQGEAWMVKLDGQPIPHSMINRERFEVLSDPTGMLCKRG